jgi:hypothetical protein
MVVPAPDPSMVESQGPADPGGVRAAGQMPSSGSAAPEHAELWAFIDTMEDRPGRVDPCFMTGKGCVYTDQIDEAVQSRTLKGKVESELRDLKEVKGFMITPFRPRLRVFFENCLRPFFYENYDPRNLLDDAEDRDRLISLERADDVARPGIIVCEGICKRIQEADFVVADISVPNDNVFYELGLAYGIGGRILLIHQKGAQFGDERARYFRKGEGERSVKQYENLERIEAEQFKVSEYFWRQDSAIRVKESEPTEVLFFEMMLDGKREKEPGPTRLDDEDIRLSFSEHVLSDIGLALRRITKDLQSPGKGQQARIPKAYLEGTIEKYLQKAAIVEPSDEFRATRDRVDNSYCLVVRTGIDCHPMAYFWLGYAHARGKNVIPITRLVMEEERPLPALDTDENILPGVSHKLAPYSAPRGKVLDLAFDIRAQRHMTFNPQHPELLEHQLEQTLSEMIKADFSEWSRRRFWATLLGSRGEVSIITGGLHSEEHNREMVGDWDLRAASELTSYFSRHQYRPKIATPIYQPEFARGPSRSGADYIEKYIRQVIRDIEIAEKTCVVIASPDVNPLTEILLGRLFSVGDDLLFSNRHPKRRYANEALIVCKERKGILGRTDGATEAWRKARDRLQRAFYQESQGKGETEQRGFWSRGFKEGDRKLLPYYGQDVRSGGKPFEIYAQLIVARNPFSTRKPGDAATPERYVVILNGVSGPATFALTQVLTGGGTKRPPSPGRDTLDQSEAILNRFLTSIRKPHFHCVYSLIKVKVGDDPRLSAAAGTTFDWRGVLSWEVVRGPDGIKEVQMPGEDQAP